MLKAKPNKIGQSLPDPWELPTATAEPQILETWQLPTEPHPLIAEVGEPAAPSLAGATANPEQVLLQDWLKLKTEQGKALAAQLGEALGLLYWAGAVPSPS
jgi:hypothetical protein